MARRRLADAQGLAADRAPSWRQGRRGRTIAFIEVKARAAREDALDAITHEKRAFIGHRVDLWRAKNPWAAHHTLRGDAVFIGRGRFPLHVPDAFPLEN
jgi:putative endonuclease